MSKSVLQRVREELKKSGFEIFEVKEYNEKFKFKIKEISSGIVDRADFQKCLQYNYVPQYVKEVIVWCFEAKKKCGFFGEEYK